MIDRTAQGWTVAMFVSSVFVCWRLLWIYAPDGWVVLFGLLPCLGIAYWFCEYVAEAKV